jgi:hypothetical protein
MHRRFAHALVLGLAATALSACAANETVVAPVQTEGSGPAETVLAVTGGEQALCVEERRTVETAIESYYALNGTDIASLDDLVPDLLRESVSARWSMSTDSGAPVITGIGICDGA